MLFVKGRRKNVVSVGWENHILQVEFSGGRRYQYGGVPEEVKNKLLRSPYPDNLFRQIVIGKFVGKRVDRADTPPVAKHPQFNFDTDIPF